MPKATLTFNLPEEQEEHQMALKGAEWQNTVWEMDQWFRNKLKHGHGFKSAEEALEEGRVELRRLVDDNGLILD